MTSTIAVVIPTWNSPERLARCLASLEPHAGHIRVWVVDNSDNANDQDQVDRVAESRSAHVMVVRMGRNAGFAAAFNEVATFHPGSPDWTFVLNDDTEVGLDFGRQLEVTARTAHALFAMIQAPMVYADDPDRIASMGLTLTDRSSGDDLHDGKSRFAHDVMTDPMTGLFCPTAGAAMYRVSALREARMSFGVMDPRHFLYYEDLDLGWRLRLLGYEPWTMLGMDPIKHAVSASVSRHPKPWIKAMQERNRVRTFIRNASEEWLDRGLFRIVEDAEDAAREQGGTALDELARAVTESWVDRRELDGKLKPGAREVLEKRWFRSSP